jgi:hypothetical protein
MVESSPGPLHGLLQKVKSEPASLAMSDGHEIRRIRGSSTPLLTFELTLTA